MLKSSSSLSSNFKPWNLKPTLNPLFNTYPNPDPNHESLTSFFNHHNFSFYLPFNDAQTVGWVALSDFMNYILYVEILTWPKDFLYLCLSGLGLEPAPPSH